MEVPPTQPSFAQVAADEMEKVDKTGEVEALDSETRNPFSTPEANPCRST